MFPRRLLLPAALLVLASFGACSDAGSLLGPDEAVEASSGPVLIECPTRTSEAITDLLGPLGGSIRLGGNALHLGLTAVLSPTEFRLETPASQYIELDITANGQEHFEFRKAARVTIDYSRCARSNIDDAPLTVWQIDPETKALIEHMGGVDDKESRSITFETDHLSTFSIAR